MKVFIIDLTLNLLLLHVVLTHVTTATPNPWTLLLWIYYTQTLLFVTLRTSLKDLDYQLWLIWCSNFTPSELAISIWSLVGACWVRRLQNLIDLIGVTHTTWKTCIRVLLLHLAMLDSKPNVDTTFCNPYDLGLILQWHKNSKAQGWFRARLDENWLEESIYGKYNFFLDQINYFWKIKTIETLRHVYAYMCMHMRAQALHAHASCMRMTCMHAHARVSETM